MNNMIIPMWTTLLVKKWEKLFVSWDILELSQIINVKISEILEQVIIHWTACWLNYLENIQIWSYGENFQPLLIAQSNISVEIPEEINYEPLLIGEPVMIEKILEDICMD